MAWYDGPVVLVTRSLFRKPGRRSVEVLRTLVLPVLDGASKPTDRPIVFYRWECSGQLASPHRCHQKGRVAAVCVMTMVVN